MPEGLSSSVASGIDVLEIHCELTKMRGSVGFGTAVATVDGERAAEAELSFVVGDVPAV